MTTIKIELPERFITALEKLAEKDLALSAVATEKETKAEPVEKPQPEEPAQHSITPEMIRAKLAPLMESGKQEAVKALLKKYGGGKLTDVPKEQYPALLKDAEAL